MKKVLVVLTITAALLSGCVGYQPKTGLGKNVVAWWNKPSTQEGVEFAKQAALNFAINAGLAALQQYAGGGPINYQQIALQGGIATLYSQASNIRQLQGTAQVFDPTATAQLLEQGGTPEEISRKLAAALVENSKALMQQSGYTLTASEAAEISAAGLDRAAVIVQTASMVEAK
jgi:hypothetical protein